MSDTLVKVLPYCVELDKPIETTELHTLFVMNDSEAHRFELEILRGGVRQEIDGSFTVTGWFMSHQGKATFKIDGTAKDGKAVVTLKKSCYSYKGQFSLIIQISKDDIETALFYGNGFMRTSRTETVIYDDFVVMDINTLLSQIDDMKKATGDANAAAKSASDAAKTASDAAKRADDEATAAQGWADATATVETLDAGEDADVSLSTAASGAKVLEFSIPRGESGVYIGTEAPTDPTVMIWIDPDGDPDELPGGVSTADLQAAVNAYLDEHPVTSGATEAQAAQIQRNKEDIQELQKNGTGSGLTAEQVNALDGMFRAAAYTRADISAVYEVFKSAFGITSKTLTGISVTYSGGDVYAGALLTDLSGIVVAAIYSDGTSETVSGYTLSGEILEGQNTITVMYNGMADTFMVTGLPLEDEETDGNEPPFDTATWTSGLRITNGGTEYTGHANYDTSSYIDVSGIEAFTISRADDVSGNISILCCFYDNAQAYISSTANMYINANSTSYPASVTIDVPSGVTYCRICGTKLSGISFGELVKITV